ncbi:MAG: hypothetical protein ABSG04_02490 [Verrucomicrobiota bacterium]
MTAAQIPLWSAGACSRFRKWRQPAAAAFHFNVAVSWPERAILKGLQAFSPATVLIFATIFWMFFHSRLVRLMWVSSPAI